MERHPWFSVEEARSRLRYIMHDILRLLNSVPSSGQNGSSTVLYCMHVHVVNEGKSNLLPQGDHLL